MPRLSGVDMLERLQAERKSVPITVPLNTFDDDEALLKSLRHGAKGLLLKHVSVERLADALRAVAAGQTMIRPAITDRVARAMDQSPPRFDSADLPDPLTRRELEVPRLMAEGFSNREIADTLQTGEGAIKNRISTSCRSSVCGIERARF